MYIDTNKIPNGVQYVAERLAHNRHEAWIVGGCVRDLLLGREVSDWDLTTSATPEEVTSCFPHVIPTGIKHGTVTIRHRGQSYEVTTLRGEGAYTDGRRPDSVHYVKDLNEDLARRDFTVNAIAADPVSGKIFDPFGGVVDLHTRVLRCVGDPMERFAEDGLRVLRAARFCAVLGFTLDKQTEAAIHLNLDTFKKVSAERVYTEWYKMLTKADKPSVGFEVMYRTGLLFTICPLLNTKTFADRHMYVMDAIDDQAADFVLRLATLFHYAGVPGDAVLSDWLHQKFKSPTNVRVSVCRLLNAYTPAYNMTDEEWRMWASSVGRDYVDYALALYWPESVHGIIHEKIDSAPLALHELEINGHDVIALGVSPREVGKTLQKCLHAVLKNPALNTKEDLLRISTEREDNVAA